MQVFLVLTWPCCGTRALNSRTRQNLRCSSGIWRETRSADYANEENMPDEGALKIVNATEQRRLDEARERGVPWKQWGRTLANANGARYARTTVRTATPGITSHTIRRARLSLGRGRARRDQRRPPAAAFRPGAMERQGPDHKGAAVRTEQFSRQSRGGRQRALFLSRWHTDRHCQLSGLSAPFPAPLCLSGAAR